MRIKFRTYKAKSGKSFYFSVDNTKVFVILLILIMLFICFLVFMVAKNPAILLTLAESLKKIFF